MSDMIMEAIGAVGQTILDAVESKKSWNPESNRYSRCFNPEVLMPLLANYLQKNDIYLLFTLIAQMNASNKIGSKVLKQIDLPRASLWRSKQKLEETYCIYEFPDGSIMINPNLVMLSKYRKNCISLQSEWSKQQKDVIQPGKNFTKDE